MKTLFTFFTHRKNRHIPAFTLVETLVSVAILTIAISGPLSVALFASAHAKDTKNKMIATWLAEEAIEIVRNKRDTFFIACTSGQSSCTFGSVITGLPENVGEASWKGFKLSNIRQKDTGSGLYLFDCYNACAYDAEGGPFNSDDGECDRLITNDFFQKGHQNAISGTHQIAKDGMYLCNVYANTTDDVGGGDRDSDFTRFLSMQVLSPLSSVSYDKNYKETIRIRSYVNYKTPSGDTKTVMVEDFLNARI